MRFIRQMTEEGWRPINLTDLPTSPRSIVSLIVNCCSHDPNIRPSFSEILRMLENQAAAEIHNQNVFSRENVFKHEQQHAHNSSSSLIPPFQHAHHSDHHNPTDHHSPIHLQHYNSYERNVRSHSNPRVGQKHKQHQPSPPRQSPTVTEQLMRNSSVSLVSSIQSVGQSNGSLMSQSSSDGSLASGPVLDRVESVDDYGDAQTVNTSQYWNPGSGSEMEFDDIPGFHKTDSRTSWKVENPHHNV
jgi:hypothetical protein